AIVEELAQRFPDHPCSHRLRALPTAVAGDIYSAIHQQERLLEQYPDNILARSDLLRSLGQTGDTLRICQVMSDIVESGRIPAINESQKWRFPPASYVTQYADYIAYTAQGLKKAMRLLRKSARYQPLYAPTYHVMGDMYCRKGRHKESLLPFLVAAGLDDTNDHFARAVADAYRFAGDERKGLDYLGERAGRLGSLVRGWEPWAAYITSMEDYGYPDEAVEIMLQAQQEREADEQLNAFAAQFWSRMGFAKRAAQALRKSRNSANKEPFLRAAVSIYDRAGNWQKALKLCRRLLDLDRKNIQVCRLYLHLFSQRHGRTATQKLAGQWVEEFPNHEGFEELYYDVLQSYFRSEQAEALVRKRLERNPYDSWAWRNLGTILLNEAGASTGEERKKQLEQANQVLEKLLGLTPNEIGTLAFRSHLEEIRGDYSKAVDYLLEALSIDPNDAYCYQNVCAHFEKLGRDEQEKLVSTLENCLFRSHGYQANARTLAFRISESFGFKAAEQAVEKWLSKIENDPALIETKADLLLNYGQGRTDAKRAVEILRGAIKRYPNRFSLRLSLAHAYSILASDQRRISLLKKIIAREPKHLVARKNLAETLAQEGRAEEAVEILMAGTEYDPQEDYAWMEAAALLWDIRRFDESLAVLQRGLQTIPESVILRERAIHYALELGKDEIAVSIAHKGTKLYPKGSYLWYLLGYALERGSVTNDLVEIEKCYRKALAYSAHMYEAIERLSIVLVAQNQFDQAREVINNVLPTARDPAPLMSQLAWITRRQGDKGKAIDELENVITGWPRHKEAWADIMEWLEIDKDWERARSILKDPHPVILEDPMLCAHRLHLLEESGVSRLDIDKQWERLLSDFPEEEVIYNRRFDMLFEKGHLDQAGLVLEAIEKYRSNSPYVLARKVQLLSRRKKWEQAVQTTLRLWQLPGEEQIWPERTAWESLAPVRERTIIALLEALRQGVFVRNNVFEFIARDIKTFPFNGTLLQQIHPSNLFRPYPKIRMLERMLRYLDSSDRDTARGKAALLDALNDLDAPNAVMRYWKRNKDMCRRQTPIWQQIGFVLATRYPLRQHQLRKWMKDWREHAGVQMVAIVNYSNSLRASIGLLGVREDIEELYATSRDVLSHLAHDHTARFHTIML
ncbi:MAG: tetratricopeptide repeat protein, partial [Planctomycetota bacterium]